MRRPEQDSQDEIDLSFDEILDFDDTVDFGLDEGYQMSESDRRSRDIKKAIEEHIEKRRLKNQLGYLLSDEGDWSEDELS